MEGLEEAPQVLARGHLGPGGHGEEHRESAHALQHHPVVGDAVQELLEGDFVQFGQQALVAPRQAGGDLDQLEGAVMLGSAIELLLQLLALLAGPGLLHDLLAVQDLYDPRAGVAQRDAWVGEALIEVADVPFRP